MSNEECQELKNIQYQTMLINNKKPIINTNNTDNISKYLSKKKICLVKKPWNKLGKGDKLNKILLYANTYSENNKLNNTNMEKIIKYLKNLLERKQLQRTKDVIYNIEKGVIIDIPGLSFNKITK